MTIANKKYDYNQLLSSPDTYPPLTVIQKPSTYVHSGTSYMVVTMCLYILRLRLKPSFSVTKTSTKKKQNARTSFLILWPKGTNVLLMRCMRPFCAHGYRYCSLNRFGNGHGGESKSGNRQAYRERVRQNITRKSRAKELKTRCPVTCHGMYERPLKNVTCIGKCSYFRSLTHGS